MQSGHGRKSGGCVELGFSKENCSMQLLGEQMSRGRGRLSWMPVKVLLYNDLVGVVTSHLTKMVVTTLDPHGRNPQLTISRICTTAPFRD